MKILCITNQEEDYLADAFIIGCKLHFKDNCHEHKIKKILYKNSDIGKVRGNGFTLYNNLPLIDSVSCENLSSNIIKQYDYIVFTSIYRQYELFLELYSILDNKKTILLDGEDKGNVFLYSWKYWKNPINWFRPKPHKLFPYFKREITEMTNYSLHYKLFSKSFCMNRPLHKNIRPISFAIPSEKIIIELPKKTKDFPIHIVDPEIAEKIIGSKTSYGFSNEEAYYKDLQESKFGITAKRGGWDCLRHYEIAANGGVICFKNLDEKPKHCAPHGLIPKENCISYIDYNDLMKQIQELNDEQYNEIQQKSMIWVSENSCEKMIQKIFTLNSVQNVLKK